MLSARLRVKLTSLLAMRVRVAGCICTEVGPRSLVADRPSTFRACATIASIRSALGTTGGQTRASRMGKKGSASRGSDHGERVGRSLSAVLHRLPDHSPVSSRPGGPARSLLPLGKRGLNTGCVARGDLKESAEVARRCATKRLASAMPEQLHARGEHWHKPGPSMQRPPQRLRR
jgi:hypothetical protein